MRLSFIPKPLILVILILSVLPVPLTFAQTPNPAPYAGTLDYGTPGRGTLSNSVAEQVWRFKGSIGDVIDIQMNAISGDLDPFLTLISPQSNSLGSNEAGDNGKDAAFYSLTLPQAGVYTLVARRSPSKPTTGDYDISVTLKLPPRGGKAALLATNGTVSGRLDRAAPVAEYRLEAGGSLAFKLELSSLHALARLRILDAGGAVLATYAGVTPLLFSASLADGGAYSVQVSAEIYDGSGTTDFTLNSYKLGAAARALRIGEPQASRSSGEQRWFFIGRAGDLVRVRIAPVSGALDRAGLLRAPGDVLIFQGNLTPLYDQPLTLPADGLYQITVAPLRNATGDGPEFTVQVDQYGALGVPFAHAEAGKVQGALSFDREASGVLAARDGWTFDASAGQTINLRATADTNNQPIAALLRAPDGSIQSATSGRGEITLRNQRLTSAGRYQFIVYDPAFPAQGIARYTARLLDTSGGSLAPDQTAKGAATPTDSSGEWTLDAAAGTVLNARLFTRTPGAWSPLLYAIGPGGDILAQTAGEDGAATLNLLGVEAKTTGRYRIVVAGRLTGSFASYELTANAQTLFAGDGRSALPQPPPETLPRFASVPATPARPASVADLIAPPLPATGLFAPEVQSLPSNTLARGELRPGALAQIWRIVAIGRTTISIEATALSGTASPQLTLLNREGKVVADALRSGSASNLLSYATETGGEFALVVRLGTEAARYILYYSSDVLRFGPLTFTQAAPLLYGQTVTGELFAASESDAYAFYGAPGDVVTAQATALTGSASFSIELATLAGRRLTATQANTFRLEGAGVYTVRVVQQSASSGRYALTLGVGGTAQLKNRVGGVLDVGQPVIGALESQSIEDVWLFSGRAGESITLLAAGRGAADQPLPLTLRLQDSAGATFAVRNALPGQDAARLDRIILPGDGLYRVAVAGGSSTQGTYRLTRLRNEPSPYIIAYAQTVGGVFNAAQNAAAWSFAGRTGDVVAVSLRYESGTPFRGGFQILADSGLVLAASIDTGDGARVEGVTLPFTGTYSILIANPQADFKGSGVYSLSLALQESRAKFVSGAIAPGNAVAGELAVADPVDQWLFYGRASEAFSVRLAAVDPAAKLTLRIKDRTGRVVRELADAQTEQTITTFAPPGDGVYALQVGGTAGPYRLELGKQTPPAAQVPQIRYGDTVPGLLASDRVVDRHSFEGQAGDRVTLRASREPGSPLDLEIELRSPSGMLIARGDSLGTDAALLADFALPENGRYEVTVTRAGGSAGKTEGRLNLSVQGAKAQFALGGSLSSGKRGLGRLTDAIPEERWNYEGTAGEVLAVTATATSGDLDTVLTVLGPDGALLAQNDDPRGSLDTNATLAAVRLPMTGTYAVIVSRIGPRNAGSGGNYEIRADRVYAFPADAAPPAVNFGYGERRIGTISASSPRATYTFIGEAGDSADITLLHGADDAPPTLSVQDPGGAELARGTLQLAVGQTAISGLRLAVRGAYTVVITQPANARQIYTPFTLTLTLRGAAVTPAQTGGILNDTANVTGALNGGANQWLFKGEAGQFLSLACIPLTSGLRPVLTFLNPAGEVLFSRSLQNGETALTVADVRLPATGLYAILITAADGRTGQYRLSARSSVPVPGAGSATLTPDRPESGTLTDLNPVATWQLRLDAGTQISARVLVTGGTLLPRLTLRAEGQPLATAEAMQTPFGASAAFEGVSIPASGFYTLTVERVGQTSGTFTILASTNPVTAARGAATSISFGQLMAGVIIPAQPRAYALVGRKGDVLALSAQRARVGDAPALTIEAPDGSIALKAAVVNGEAAVNAFSLPADGRYIVTLEAGQTAGFTLTVQRRQDMLAGAARGRTLVNDTSQENGITVTAPFNFWTLNANAGERVLFTVKPISATLRLDVSLYNAAGDYLGALVAANAGESLTFGPIEIPATGAYQLVVGRWLGAFGTGTGRYSVTLQKTIS